MVVKSVKRRSNPSTAEQAVPGHPWGVGAGERGMNTRFMNEWQSRV